ncbi:hypothetical protein [Ruminiclostridium cellobioparum]|nr:hypothetical protein [Ruminiclostridium cellobioparum]
MDDIIEILIKKIMEEEAEDHAGNQKAHKKLLRGEKPDGIPASSGKRK